jgi:antitoxin component YwqK of YwqJK toxin-antitoxin module
LFTHNFYTRFLLQSFFIFIFCLTSAASLLAQVEDDRVLYIVDSFPVIDDPEEWNKILPEDIADARELKDADSLKLLGLADLGKIIYVFTKEYRKRPDSLKRVPCLKQMYTKNGSWFLNGMAYSGKYIDYYNNGRLQNVGTLLNGKLDGELKIYYQNGNIKSVGYYKDGLPDGSMVINYRNGSLLERREYLAGRITNPIKMQFHAKNSTRFDTVFTYYSSGNVKRIALIYNGKAVVVDKTDKINYLSLQFDQSINKRDFIEANKIWLKLNKLDNGNADTYFKIGLLCFLEYRFANAITEFGKALEIEPLLKEALVYRALTRIKIRQFADAKVSTREEMLFLMGSNKVVPIPPIEKAMICDDLRKAEVLEISETPMMNLISTGINNYCKDR